MKKTKRTNEQICSICRNTYKGFGNNAWPINDGRCCDDCDFLVILKRIQNLKKKYEGTKVETGS